MASVGVLAEYLQKVQPFAHVTLTFWRYRLLTGRVRRV